MSLPKPHAAVLVIGDARYVGSHTCKTLAEAGYYPIVYDNLEASIHEH